MLARNTSHQLDAKESLARIARIELKTSPEVKLELEQAASAEGVSTTAFILSRAVADAKRINEARQVIRLNKMAFAELDRILANPEPAPPALKELMQMED